MNTESVSSIYQYHVSTIVLADDPTFDYVLTGLNDFETWGGVYPPASRLQRPPRGNGYPPAFDFSAKVTGWLHNTFAACSQWDVLEEGDHSFTHMLNGVLLSKPYPTDIPMAHWIIPGFTQVPVSNLMPVSAAGYIQFRITMPEQSEGAMLLPSVSDNVSAVLLSNAWIDNCGLSVDSPISVQIFIKEVPRSSSLDPLVVYADHTSYDHMLVQDITINFLQALGEAGLAIYYDDTFKIDSLNIQRFTQFEPGKTYQIGISKSPCPQFPELKFAFLDVSPYLSEKNYVNSPLEFPDPPTIPEATVQTVAGAIDLETVDYRSSNPVPLAPNVYEPQHYFLYCDGTEEMVRISVVDANGVDQGFNIVGAVDGAWLPPLSYGSPGGMPIRCMEALTHKPNPTETDWLTSDNYRFVNGKSIGLSAYQLYVSGSYQYTAIDRDYADNARLGSFIHSRVYTSLFRGTRQPTVLCRPRAGYYYMTVSFYEQPMAHYVKIEKTYRSPTISDSVESYDPNGFALDGSAIQCIQHEIPPGEVKFHVAVRYGPQDASINSKARFRIYAAKGRIPTPRDFDLLIPEHSASTAAPIEVGSSPGWYEQSVMSASIAPLDPPYGSSYSIPFHTSAPMPDDLSGTWYFMAYNVSPAESRSDAVLSIMSFDISNAPLSLDGTSSVVVDESNPQGAFVIDRTQAGCRMALPITIPAFCNGFNVHVTNIGETTARDRELLFGYYDSYKEYFAHMLRLALVVSTTPPTHFPGGNYEAFHFPYRTSEYTSVYTPLNYLTMLTLSSGIPLLDNFAYRQDASNSLPPSKTYVSESAAEWFAGNSDQYEARYYAAYRIDPSPVARTVYLVAGFVLDSSIDMLKEIKSWIHVSLNIPVAVNPLPYGDNDNSDPSDDYEPVSFSTQSGFDPAAYQSSGLLPDVESFATDYYVDIPSSGLDRLYVSLVRHNTTGSIDYPTSSYKQDFGSIFGFRLDEQGSYWNRDAVSVPTSTYSDMRTQHQLSQSLTGGWLNGLTVYSPGASTRYFFSVEPGMTLYPRDNFTLSFNGYKSAPDPDGGGGGGGDGENLPFSEYPIGIIDIDSISADKTVLLLRGYCEILPGPTDHDPDYSVTPRRAVLVSLSRPLGLVREGEGWYLPFDSQVQVYVSSSVMTASPLYTDPRRPGYAFDRSFNSVEPFAVDNLQTVQDSAEFLRALDGQGVVVEADQNLGRWSIAIVLGGGWNSEVNQPYSSYFWDLTNADPAEGTVFGVTVRPIHELASAESDLTTELVIPFNSNSEIGE